MLSLTFGLFTQMSDSGPHGPLVFNSVYALIFMGESSFKCSNRNIEQTI